MTDSLYQEPEKDGFASESPIRAFTDFKVDGAYAIGKGFRPSLAHLTTYLDAMFAKEKWRLVQVLESATGHPSILFERVDGLGSTLVGVIPPAEALDAYGLLPPEWPEAFKRGARADLARLASGAEKLRDTVKNFGETYEPKLREDRLPEQPDIGAPHQTVVLVLDENGHESSAIYKGWRWYVIVRWEQSGPIITRPVDTPKAWRRSVYDDWTYEKPWHTRGSEAPIPDDNYMSCATFVLQRHVKPRHQDSAIREFGKNFKPPKNHASLSHKGLVAQLSFHLHRVDVSRIKKDIDDYRAAIGEIRQQAIDGIRTPERPEVSSEPNDPINPSHYAGRACADIGERLSANGYQILKYCWRLGKKDDPCQELGKAIWYAESEMNLLIELEHHYADLHMKPRIVDMDRIDNDGLDFLEKRIADQPEFTQNIARMLWAGYNRRKLQCIVEAIQEHKFHLDCGRGLAV